MKTPGKNKRSPKTAVKVSFTDHVTRRKIKKHLGDIHDVITEEDIKNVRVPGKDLPASKSKEKEEPTQPGTGNEGNPALNAWDILEE